MLQLQLLQVWQVGPLHQHLPNSSQTLAAAAAALAGLEGSSHNTLAAPQPDKRLAAAAAAPVAVALEKLTVLVLAGATIDGITATAAVCCSISTICSSGGCHA
jgi:hypothetical protein